MKRVRALYRVSTISQLQEGDIPMQRIACRDYVTSQKEWELNFEYVEKGVSGFSKKFEHRDIIADIRRDAKLGKFEILLVWMLDRLGRSTEIPSLLRELRSSGVAVWSVLEGEQRIDNYSEYLATWARSWQAEGESIRTSVRVNERHAQMAKNGLFRGGSAPFGYKLAPTGKLTEDGKELMDYSICEEQQPIVEMIFVELCHNRGMGGQRIAKILNEKGVPSKTGKGWAASTLNYMLRNPIYKGYPAYGKNARSKGRAARQPADDWVLPTHKREDLAIVPEHLWNRIQDMREKRNLQKSDGGSLYIKNTKGPLLLIGLVRCGACGSPLTTTYSYKSYRQKDGTDKKTQRILYRCSGKALARVYCEGQTTYGKDYLEKKVLSLVSQYMEFLHSVDFFDIVDSRSVSVQNEMAAEISDMEQRLSAAYRQLEALNNEIPNAILGESPFNSQQLAVQIDKKNDEVLQLTSVVATKKKMLCNEVSAMSDLNALREYKVSWNRLFNSAVSEKKKAMLASVIKVVRVWSDKVDVEFVFFSDQFRQWCS